MLQLLCGFIMVGIVVAYPPVTNFCATFSPASAGGASGYFAMQVNQATGLSYYNFALDLSQFPLAAQCTATGSSSKLKYHIHSFWKLSGQSSYSSANCGASGTGGHYDPGFACSGSSCFAKTPTANLCKNIYRTSVQGYKYGCNSTTFGSDVNVCEVGDLSGKFGLATVQNNLVSSNGVYTDPLPPAVVDYYRSSQTNYSTPFASVVFHCNDAPTNTPILCAKLNTDISACQSSSATFGAAPVSASSGAKSYSQTAFDGAVAGAAIVCLLTGLLVGILWQRMQFNSKVASDGIDKIPSRGDSLNPVHGN
jgi:hypothetical protein